MSSAEPRSLRVDDLFVRFPGRPVDALSGVTAHIDPGQAIAIAGPSGCGKTTLLRTLAGFIPDMVEAEVRGNVRLDGALLPSLDLAQLSSAVGLVQQDPDAQICTLRVRSEVAFGPENLLLPADDVQSRVAHALGALGLELLTGRDTTTLSGGEKQRLAVAAILAMRPSVILLDEPTAHLDPAGAKDLFALLRALQQETGATLMVVEHRLPPLVGLHPQLWIMDRGRIVRRHEARVHEDVSQWTRPVPIDPSRRPTRAFGEALHIESVGFGYSNPLLDRLSVRVERGTILGVIGPNGGGKTTLLRLVADLMAPDEGRIVRPPGQSMGMVFQHPHQQIFERSVRRDLEIEGALDESSLRGLLESARLAGMADVAPHALSLGEQRRLTVLSAFRGGPDLLLLDEPFIGQDRANVAWIVEQIERARQRGAIILLVTHDIPMANALCDRLLFLGEDAVSGTPSEVFAALSARGQDAFTPGFWEDVG